MDIKDFSIEEYKKKAYEEAEKKGVEINEDELNARILELSRMDPEELEKTNGGWCFWADDCAWIWAIPF